VCHRPWTRSWPSQRARPSWWGRSGPRHCPGNHF
jgi:hypothetical protein